MAINRIPFIDGTAKPSRRSALRYLSAVSLLPLAGVARCAESAASTFQPGAVFGASKGADVMNMHSRIARATVDVWETARVAYDAAVRARDEFAAGALAAAWADHRQLGTQASFQRVQQVEDEHGDLGCCAHEALTELLSTPAPDLEAIAFKWTVLETETDRTVEWDHVRGIRDDMLRLM